ncbi:hypothetical protein D6850_13130 [Roseovarius spongiae]|uniref:50S ribosomal protein L35 n=1 Tax=Roseovarius spongiae TaxID=2320272 RepID=A0A3A8B2V8_9RHOB|nr:hypothetical protein [Roseovarius spongiae]RKF14235.1 hypothetical protein D6850_13130 [Roseovarius spongiae]
MNSDLILVIGIVLGVFALPAIVSALSDGRAPRVAAFVLIAAGVLVVYAIREKPGGYTLQDVPNAFVRVAASVMR